MSLVGTRPPTVDEWEKYELHHRSRMSTKPGITGMWQVSGRSDITDFEEVVRLDTEYIEHWTIFYYKTWVVISGKGKTVVDGMEQSVRVGDVITMAAGCRHTVIAETELKLIEVQLGEDINVHDKQKFELEY